jgi:hypothetical protein
MKQRTAIHMFLSLAVAVMLIICGTAFQTHYSANPQEWLNAHRQTPLLWLVDFTALYTLVLMATLARARRRLYRQAEEMYVLREEHHNQLGAIIARASEVDEINAQQAERLEQVEAEAQSRQESFEAEARRMVEQMFRALQGEVEAHTRQLDAVNLALQYQRAELSELRHHLRAQNPALEIPASARLSPAEVAAITDGLPTLVTQERVPAALPTHPQNVVADPTPASETMEAVAVVESPASAPSMAVSSEEPNTDSSSPDTPLPPRSNTPQERDSLTENEAAVFDPTANARSTFVLDTAEFDAFSASPPPKLPQNASNGIS